jgi:esterase/lipase
MAAAGLAWLLCAGLAQAQLVSAPARIQFSPLDIQPARALQTPRAPQSYDAAMAAFQGYIAAKRPLVKNESNLPFLLTHGQKTGKSILMIHGLTDSPYYMRTLAGIFYLRGYNVVSILVPGHGTKPEDLLKMSLTAWQLETEFGLSVAQELGDEISLAGFSTGGALALDALAKNMHALSHAVASDAGAISCVHPKHARPLAGVYLFSPALKISSPKAPLTCLPFFSRFKPWAEDAPESIVENHPYRYKKLATNAVCQLYKATLIIDFHRKALMSYIAANKVGVFAVESEADTTVSPEAVKRFMDELPGSVDKELVWYPKSAGIPHAAVTRPESNPLYGELSLRLDAFLAKRDIAPDVQASTLDLPTLQQLRTLPAAASGERITSSAYYDGGPMPAVGPLFQ